MSAITNIEVDTDLLGRDIESFQAEIKGLEQELNGMYEAVVSLNGMWKGEANMAFNRQFNRDHNTMAEMLRSLSQHAELLSYAKGEYRTCESMVLQSVQALR